MGLGFYRRTFHDLIGSDNILVSPADFTPRTVANPLGGAALTIWNLDPAKRAAQQIVDTNDPNQNYVYNGVDVNFQARMGGGRLLGGVTTERWVIDNCSVDDPNSPIPGGAYPGTTGGQYCNQSEHDIPFKTQAKLSGFYPLPVFGLELVFMSFPGERAFTNYQVTPAISPGLTQASITEFQSHSPIGPAEMCLIMQEAGQKMAADVFQCRVTAHLATLSHLEPPARQVRQRYGGRERPAPFVDIDEADADRTRRPAPGEAARNHGDGACGTVEQPLGGRAGREPADAPAAGRSDHEEARVPVGGHIVQGPRAGGPGDDEPLGVQVAGELPQDARRVVAQLALHAPAADGVRDLVVEIARGDDQRCAGEASEGRADENGRRVGFPRVDADDDGLGHGFS